MGKRRPSGDGMVRKREDGRWEGRIVIGHKENGDSIFRYIYADTQKELTVKLRQNINAYQGVDLTEGSSMTLSQWLDKWLEEYIKGTVRESTLEGYRRDIMNHVIPYLGEKQLRKITGADLRSLDQKLLERGRMKGGNHAAGLSPTTVHSIHILRVLERCRKSGTSRWMFPSPKKEDSPLDPAAVRKKLTAVLKRAGCKHVRFHDLRHTFATNALEHGMDIKTLSAIIGHVSSATTLNVYAHVTDEMRQKAADRIDRGIAGVEPPAKAVCKKKAAASPFQAVKGKYRKPGTGCITKINDHLWEGRYSPKVNGKRIARNVYASTEEECERKLAELIEEMKKELTPLRTKKKAG